MINVNETPYTSDRKYGDEQTEVNNDIFDTVSKVINLPKFDIDKSSTNQLGGENDISSSFKIIEYQEYTFPYLDEFINNLTSLIKNDEFRVGYFSNSSIYFKNILEKYPETARKCLLSVFADNVDKKHIIYGILSILTEIEYSDIYPEGLIIAMASKSVPDKIIKEAFVRLFENWCNKDALKFIKVMKFDEEWLENYRLEVIEDIEEYI